NVFAGVAVTNQPAQFLRGPGLVALKGRRKALAIDALAQRSGKPRAIRPGPESKSAESWLANSEVEIYADPSNVLSQSVAVKDGSSRNGAVRAREARRAKVHVEIFGLDAP